MGRGQRTITNSRASLRAGASTRSLKRPVEILGNRLDAKVYFPDGKFIKLSASEFDILSRIDSGYDVSFRETSTLRHAGLAVPDSSPSSSSGYLLTNTGQEILAILVAENIEYDAGSLNDVVYTPR
jgi:hypothetical protein